MKTVLAVIVAATVLCVGAGSGRTLIGTWEATAQDGTGAAEMTPVAAEPAKPADAAPAVAADAPKPAETAEPAAAPQEDPYAKATAAGIVTKEQRMSYSIGYDIGIRFRRQEIQNDVDLDVFVRGIRAGIADSEEILTKDQMTEIIMALNDEIRTRLEEKHRLMATRNKAAGEAFLAENAKKEGVIVRESGVQYKILELGEGPKPNGRDTVTVDYRGTLIDGTEFDSSYKRGQPAKLPLTSFIPGWAEAVAQLPVGTKAMIWIPAELAYGDRGTPSIEPNSTLVFEVKLLAAEPAPEQPKPSPQPQLRPRLRRPQNPQPQPTPAPEPSPAPQPKGDAAQPSGDATGTPPPAPGN
ncbi:MAG: FKBP-type peptidyl-prolyl cis-trans isomerase [Phycisphaerae bacterium]|nr:FKBP-type peptidyl-prolyl cis-trans isomerase [Phycisphaerae bacterium]